jgi:hypothetical protein
MYQKFLANMLLMFQDFLQSSSLPFNNNINNQAF